MMRVTRITRHPIKGHGREDLASVCLLPDQCLPWDRHWALAHEAAKLEPGWSRCSNFLRGAKAPQLMALTSTLDEATGVVELSHPDLGSYSFRPDEQGHLEGYLAWAAPLYPAERAQPTHFVTGTRGMTDSDFASISILSERSLQALSERMGVALSPHRFRGNIWIEGAEPFAEFDWIGRKISIGTAVLRIEQRITRCVATTVNPDTGLRDADTLAALQAAYGHRDFGIYARVVEGGSLATGDDWTVQ